MVKSKSKLWVELFISPAWCFISSISQIRRGNISAIWTIPYIMGLIAFLFPPFADFARSFSRVYEGQDLPLVQVILLCGDIVLPTFEYVFLKLGIPIEFFRFLYTFVVYHIINKIFVDLTSKYQLPQKKFFYVWVFLFMQIEFFAYIDNIRTIFVRLMLLYCGYQYFINNLNKYRYWACLLCVVHYAYFPIIFLFFISKYLKFKVTRIKKIVLIFSILFSSSLSNYIDLVSFVQTINMGNEINNRIVSYTTGEWSADGDSMNSYSRLYYIYVFLIQISVYLLWYIYAKMKFNFRLENFIVPLALLCFICGSIPVMAGRYIGFFNVYVALLVLIGYLENKITNNQMRFYIMSCIFTTFVNVYSNWNCLVNGHVFYLLFPVPIALFQTYDFVEWCTLHLTDDFNKIINGNFLSR